MRVLLTRPREEASALAARLAARGIETLVEPLLSIHPLAVPPLALTGVQALAVTSANGARALGRVWPVGAPRLPVFAVGPASAAAARAAGFCRVEAGAEDVAALAQLVAARLDPAAGAVLHAAGSEVAGDLAGLLAVEGFAVRRAVLYRADPALALSAATIAALTRGEIDAVLLYSPRTAMIFAALVHQAGLIDACRTLTAYCLSASVAAAATLPFREVRVAAHPSEEALLALLQGERSRP